MIGQWEMAMIARNVSLQPFRRQARHKSELACAVRNPTPTTHQQEYMMRMGLQKMASSQRSTTDLVLSNSPSSFRPLLFGLEMLVPITSWNIDLTRFLIDSPQLYRKPPPVVTTCQIERYQTHNEAPLLPSLHSTKMANPKINYQPLCHWTTHHRRRLGVVWNRLSRPVSHPTMARRIRSWLE